MGKYRLLVFLTVAAIFILSTLLAGCGRKPMDKHLRYSVGAEPQTVDPRKSTGSPEATIEAQIFEGLTALDRYDHPIPAAAQRWDISPDEMKYTFFLRESAKWSNGDPVTAKDFVFAWRSALDPNLASGYAYQLYYLKNGEAYNKGLATAEQIGVKAIDDHTLEVTLEKPTAYFLSLLAFHTYYPVHRSTAQSNEKWAAKVQTIIGNGPFKMTKWVHNSKIEFERNEYYWDAAKVKSNKLTFILTENSATELALFENGLIDMGNNPPISEISRLIKEDHLQIHPYLGTYFYCFNVTKPPFDDPKIRKAFSLVIDREAIIKNVVRGQQKAALGWVPFGLPDAKADDDFRLVGGDLLKDKDVETAKTLLSSAGYPDGQNLPPITLLYNTSESHKAVAEAIQEMWRKNLGVNVSLVNQEWKVFLSSRHRGDYQVSRHGWLGDYADPMTFLDMFTSDSGNNDAQYKNSDYDKLITLAKKTSNPTLRLQALHTAEKMLLDDAVIAPIYFYTQLTMVTPHVKGYTHSVLGVTYFKEAYLE
ncbi:MAG: peptide ABC transporter substrate-binding protein [Veillonellales bacterium]